jgi:hypothetical protein
LAVGTAPRQGRAPDHHGSTAEPLGPHHLDASLAFALVGRGPLGGTTAA